MDQQLLNYLKINPKTYNSKFNALLGKGPSEELETIFKLAKKENINPFGYFQHEDNIYSDYYHHTVAKKILSYCNKLENKENTVTYLNYLTDNGLTLTLHKFNDENENSFHTTYYPYLYSFLRIDNIKKENKFLSSFVVEHTKKEGILNEEMLLQSISYAHNSNSRLVDSFRASPKEKSLLASTKYVSSELSRNHLQTLFFDSRNVNVFSFSLDDILLKYKKLKDNNNNISKEVYSSIYSNFIKSYQPENYLDKMLSFFSIQEINDFILSPNISMGYSSFVPDKLILKIKEIEPGIGLNSNLISEKQKYDIMSCLNNYKFNDMITNCIDGLYKIGFQIKSEDVFNYMKYSVNELRQYNNKEDFFSYYIQTLIDNKNNYENLSKLLDHCYDFFSTPHNKEEKFVARELANINLSKIFNISAFDDEEYINIISKINTIFNINNIHNIYNLNNNYNTAYYAKPFCDNQIEYMIKDETLRIDENTITKYKDNNLNPFIMSLNSIIRKHEKQTFTEYEKQIFNSELLWNEDLYPAHNNFIKLSLDKEESSQKSYVFAGKIIPLLEKIDKNPWQREYNNSTTLFDKVIRQTDLLIKKDILPPIVQRWIENNKHYLEKGDNINLDNISNEPLKIYLSKIVLEKTFENSKTLTSKKRL